MIGADILLHKTIHILTALHDLERSSSFSSLFSLVFSNIQHFLQVSPFRETPFAELSQCPYSNPGLVTIQPN